MNIISIENAKAGILIPIGDVMPLAGLYTPDLCPLIAERYSFVSSPDFSQFATKIKDKGLEFEIGKFQHEGEEHLIAGFLAYRAGFIVSTASTEIAKAFLEDVLVWATETQGFRITPDILAKMVFLSQIVVEFEGPLSKLIRGFEVISSDIGKAMKATYKVDIPLDFSSLGFDYDRTVVSNRLGELSEFRIDRRVDQPYESNRFFCSAPLPTKDHIRLLEKIERLLTGDLGWADS